MLTVYVNYKPIEASDISWSSVDPGGHEACSFTVPRSQSYPKPGDRIEVRDDLATVWLGRVEEPGNDYDHLRSAGHVSAVGYGAIFKDNQISDIFIDRDLSRWQGMSVQRQINYGSTSDPRTTPTVEPDGSTGNPSLKLQVGGPIPGASGGVCEAWYDAGEGNAIIQFQLQSAVVVNASGSSWLTQTVLSDDDVATGANILMSDQDANTVAFRRDTAGSGQRYAYITWRFTTSSASTTEFYRLVSNVAVIGDHGVTLRQVGAGQDGFYPADIAQYICNQVSGIDLGHFESSTSFVLVHSAYPEPVPHEDILNDMATLMGWHWGVWDSGLVTDGTPKLHFRSRPSTITVNVDLVECSSVSLAKSLSSMFNAARVAYQDAEGMTKYVSVSYPHPDIPSGLTRTVQLSAGVSTSANATVYGQQILQLLQRDTRAHGSVQLPPTVFCSNGAQKPSHLLKAGLDRIFINGLQDMRFTEDKNVNAFRIQRVSCAQQGNNIVTSIELDSGANLIETLEARLAAGRFRGSLSKALPKP